MTSTLARPRSTSTPTGPATHLPTRLRPTDLLRITDQGAADVLDGRYNHLLPTEWDTVNRWATRLEADDDLDVWLISWTPNEHTELHDHAGSLGALTVLSGSLLEYRWNGAALRRRTLDAGDQASFPLGWVHDVVANPHAAPLRPVAATSSTPPAVSLSVHAYSPPLTAMSYYEVTEHQTLRRTRTTLTDQPE